MKKLLILFTKIFVGIFVFFMVLGTAVYVKYRLDLPNIEELVEDYKAAEPTIIYDRNGEVVDKLFIESRNIVDIEDVPQSVKNAFLAIEDKKFYEHFGINPKRVLGAIVQNIKNKRVSQGASTITQQLAKNAFLTPEKKLSRKIKEAIITIELERRYTKEEILERYLNEIYYGSGYYGVRTASLNFFKKELKDLNIAEAAMLAGIPNRPSKYDPTRNLDNAIERQQLVLKEMLRDGRISQEEYTKAINHKFVKNDGTVKADENTTLVYEKKSKRNIKNPDFTDLVEDFLQEILPENLIYGGGLRVHTTLDLNHQKTAKEVFENYPTLKKNKDLNGALITVDQYGGIVSIVGGKNFKTKNFNRAVMAKRQVGSAIKPFVYLNALLNGFEANTVVEDNYISYGKWAPKNYGDRYSGNNTLGLALNKSINTIAVKLLDAGGLENFEKMAEDLNFKPKEDITLSAALGAIEMTPLRLALSYTIFINGGYKVSSHVVTSVENDLGNIIYERDVPNERLYDPVSTSSMTAMLKDVVATGSGSSARVLKNGKAIEQGGKTGTTNENRTLWFAGITPEYVTVIYIGKDNNKPTYGNVTGGRVVAPLWKAYYQALINNKFYAADEKFPYLKNGLETGELFKQSIDPQSGLISASGRPTVIRVGRIQVEYEQKYKNGIASIFGLDEETRGYGGFFEKDTTNNYVDDGRLKEIEGTWDANSHSNSNFNNNQNHNTSDGDHLFDRLLGD